MRNFTGVKTPIEQRQERASAAANHKAAADLHVLVSAPHLQNATDLAPHLGEAGVGRAWVVTP